EIPRPERNITNAESHELELNMGDFLYLLASNTGGQDETIYVSVKLLVNGEEKPGTVHTFDLKGGYSAKLWTISVACRYMEVAGTNGSVMKDSVTGLQWQRCRFGQTWNPGSKSCEGTSTLLNANDAFDLTMDGGWRTPTTFELSTLLYCTDGTFPLDNSWFWTSSWWEMCVGDQCEGYPYAMNHEESKPAAISNLLPVRLVKSPY
ncbi:MAG: DUF1566 domain-containing protein, partial [Desulfamplus sp.]|nr:DUF1566 domain-containing protein [Desulfamplus sp.]